MVKKKRNRHQQEPVTQNGGDSTESCDENQADNSGGKCCPHVSKAVDLTKVKKALRTAGIASECTTCAKSPAVAKDNELQEDIGLWLCLKCGNQACGRTRKGHALEHHRTPRSDPHPLVVNTTEWNVWCYDCSCEIAAQCRKKLHECIEFIKRQEEVPPAPFKKKIGAPAIEKNGEKNPDEQFVKNSSTVKNGKGVSDSSNLPRVRGLCNVGNTCFFNAVLQCLAQTPFLLPVLQEMSEPGTKFSLPGNPEDLPTLEGELGKWGTLTEILASTLIELQSSKCDVYNPSRLLNKLIQRYPQFGGGEQHDSHELLRHLLEGVRSEDLKRYQAIILHMLGLTEKSNPTEVEDDLRKKAKAYGRQASEMMLHPEQVFRGFLVSTLECQDCLHSSQRVETFLDLSLPVMADKPQPPILRRKSNNDESFDLCGKPTDSQPSKHQLKKERKQQRKERKKMKGWNAEGEQPAIAEENATAKNSGESEQSDADVEDNVEDSVDPSSKVNGTDVGESGYSSEKLGNEDSTVESPVSQLANEDSALASPASPANMEDALASLLSDLQDSSTKPAGDVPEESTKELSVAIPTTPPANLLYGESAGSPVSPISNRGTPSPVSSEVNIDCSSSISMRVNGECASPDCNGDFNRPISRFGFCQDEDAADVDSVEGVPRYSPVEDDCSVQKNPISDLCENMSQLSVDYYSNTCTKFVLLPNPNVNGFEENHLMGGEDRHIECNVDVSSTMDRIIDEDRNVQASPTFKSIDDFYKYKNRESSHSVSNDKSIESFCNNVNNTDNPSSVRSNDNPSIVSHMENTQGASEIKNANSEGKGDILKKEVKTQSNGEVLNCSATVSARYQCDDGECSIQSCLNQFTALELMTGNNKVGCENCTERQNKGKDGKMVCTNSTKQLLMKTPPAVLILHLKRFQVHRTTFRKVCRLVTFPLVLDIAPICSAAYKDCLMMKPGQNQVLYALYGVVEHSGNLHGGHYVAYVKVRPPLKENDPRWSFLSQEPNAPKKYVDQEESCNNAIGGTAEAPPGKWYFVSDSRVQEVKEDRVLRSQAYLLFYERIW